MNLNEFLELNEGIILFKTSNKLNSLIKKLKKKSFKLNPKNRHELEKTILDLEEIKNEFKKVEDNYLSSKDKQAVRKEYKQLESKYITLLESLKKDKTRKTLKNLGVAGLILSSIGITLGGLVMMSNSPAFGGFSSLGDGSELSAASVGIKSKIALGSDGLDLSDKLLYNSVAKATQPYQDKLLKLASLPLIGSTVAAFTNKFVKGKNLDRLRNETKQILDIYKEEENKKEA